MKKTFITILILAVLLVGSYMIWGKGGNDAMENIDQTLTTQNSGSNQPSATSTNSSTSTGSNTGFVATYTKEEVAAHNNSKDCWAIVGTSVYNLTNWINKHPGGEKAILSLCGKDGTTAFENQHGGQSRPENALAGFFIGTLKLQ